MPDRVGYVKTQPSLARADRIGMVGYCFGGGITRRSTEAIPEQGPAAYRDTLTWFQEYLGA
ncbi:MAG: dienelactone hydrolase family protein [Chloroflexi bacterium]|nr:dienelactone hydrolase family protein [Chloroflexota bacterium]